MVGRRMKLRSQNIRSAFSAGFRWLVVFRRCTTCKYNPPVGASHFTSNSLSRRARFASEISMTVGSSFVQCTTFVISAVVACFCFFLHLRCQSISANQTEIRNKSFQNSHSLPMTPFLTRVTLLPPRFCFYICPSGCNISIFFTSFRTCL